MSSDNETPPETPTCDVTEDEESHLATTVSEETRRYVAGIGDELEGGELPLRVYNDAEIYELEKERIFAENWVFIGHETEIPEPGDYVRRYIGEDPFIFVRDEEGDVNVLFDSCRHRGSKVCRAEKGNTSHFRCPYHGWTYKNNGDLAGVPRMQEGYDGMDTSEWGLLSPPRVANYRGLVFASLNEDVPDFDEYIGDYKWYLDIHFGLTEGGMEVVGDPFRYRINSNWKVGAENFAGDGYHTHTTHRSAVDTFVEKEWSWEGGRDYQFISDIEGHHNYTTLMGLFSKEDIEAYWGYPDEVLEHLNTEELDEDQLDIARRSAIHVGTLFPNLSVHHQTATPPGEGPRGFLSLRKWSPRGPDEMEVLNLILAPKEASKETKEKIHQAAVYTFGPSGNFDQDDVAVWSGIVDSAGSMFAKKHDLKLNYKMGLGDIGHAEQDPDWPGPGFSSETIHEGYSRTLHGNWAKAMQDPADQQQTEDDSEVRADGDD
jgi:nitrite reductase/ring-hydroxylating ferredoxin subunit